MIRRLVASLLLVAPFLVAGAVIADVGGARTWIAEVYANWVSDSVKSIPKVGPTTPAAGS